MTILKIIPRAATGKNLSLKAVIELNLNIYIYILKWNRITQQVKRINSIELDDNYSQNKVYFKTKL